MRQIYNVHHRNLWFYDDENRRTRDATRFLRLCADILLRCFLHDKTKSHNLNLRRVKASNSMNLHVLHIASHMRRIEWPAIGHLVISNDVAYVMAIQEK